MKITEAFKKFSKVRRLISCKLEFKSLEVFDTKLMFLFIYLIKLFKMCGISQGSLQRNRMYISR